MSDIIDRIDAAVGCQQCSVNGCQRRARSRGWCGTHYERWRRTGSTDLMPVTRDYVAVLADRSERRGQCLLYVKGTITRSGYGRLSYKGVYTLAHRLAWMLANGPIPDGLMVCHRCDVPNCINVEHLFLGTAADNNHDRDRKGRHRPMRGSKAGKAKLSEWQVQEIKAKLRQGRTLHSLGAEYGVAWQTISSIKIGQNWAHVDPPPDLTMHGDAADAEASRGH